MDQSVLVYRGEALARYGFGEEHPFGVDRHDVFHEELATASNCNGAVHYADPADARVDDLLLFHSADYIDKVSRMSAEGRGFLDGGDTPAVNGIFDAASTVVGTTMAAVDAVMAGPVTRAFVPIAGLHHAGREHAAGFCVFNDCGVAAEYLRRKYGLRRIAYAIFAIVPFGIISQSWMDTVTHGGFQLSLDLQLGTIAIGLLALSIAEIYKAGITLQDEAELTV